MENSQILILVASEQGATLCVNCDGISELFAAYPSTTRPSQADSNVTILADIRRPYRALAVDLMAELRRCAMTGAYEGIVISATYELMRELQMAMDCKVRKLLIAALLEKPQCGDHETVEAARFPRDTQVNRRAV